MCDLFLILDKMYFAGYADKSDVIKPSEEISKPLKKWFKDN